MKLALAQIDPTVGDLDGNRELILARIEEARSGGADLVVLPELAVTGYPPEDLLLRPGFVRAARASIEQIAAATRGIVALVGVPLLDDGDLYNACAICADGEIAGWAKKWHLPNYGVFDEKRYFASGDETSRWSRSPARRSGSRSARTCGFPGRRRPSSPRRAPSSSSTSRPPRSTSAGAQEREAIFAARARESGVRVALCNTVGGQDELIFDGHSLVHRERRHACSRGRPASRRRCSSSTSSGPRRPRLAPLDDDLEQMRRALVLGLRDYVAKNGFDAVVVSVSGGIDSAVTAALAVEALGAERVHCVSMPSRYSSGRAREPTRAGSPRTSAATSASSPIEPVVEAYDRRPRGVVRRARAGRRRGEPPGADPRDAR